MKELLKSVAAAGAMAVSAFCGGAPATIEDDKKKNTAVAPLPTMGLWEKLQYDLERLPDEEFVCMDGEFICMPPSVKGKNLDYGIRDVKFDNEESDCGWAKKHLSRAKLQEASCGKEESE